MRLETVTIETENGPVIINKSDYDPATHSLAGEKKRRGPKAKASR